MMRERRCVLPALSLYMAMVYGAASSCALHVPVVGCVGNGGGVSQCGVLKSKNSSKPVAAASRAVSEGTLNWVSMNFRIDVSSRGVCETKFGLTHGETSTNGTRIPETSNFPAMSPARRMGAVPSGGGTWNGAA